MRRKIAVYGIGGHGREIASLVQNGMTVDGDDMFIGFIDDSPRHVGAVVNGAPVFSLKGLAAEHPDAEIVCGVGAPRIREKLAGKCEQYKFRFATVIYAGARLSPLVSFGEGSVLFLGAVMTTNIRTGRHVHINVGCTISHDVDIGDFAIINPGAHVNGWVRIGARAYVGAGAVIVNGNPREPLEIGDDAVVGAGACVIRPVPAGATVVGVPARPLRDRWATE